MIRIVTDTASDITRSQAERMGIDLVEIPITFEDGPCAQAEEKDFETFYERLKTCAHLPVTSRPTPDAYRKIYEQARRDGDDVVVLTLSSGLSGTYDSALMAQKMAGYDRVHVVDTHQAILAQRMLVECAVDLRSEGYSAADIARLITQRRDQVMVCGLVGSLKYLHMGGRIPASLALAGKMLHIKPVIVLKDKILQSAGKVRGAKAGTAALHKLMEEAGVNKAYPLYFGYTSDRELGDAFMQATREKYPSCKATMHPIGGIIGTHCGMDCMAVAFMMLK